MGLLEIIGSIFNNEIQIKSLNMSLSILPLKIPNINGDTHMLLFNYIENKLKTHIDAKPKYSFIFKVCFILILRRSYLNLIHDLF